MEALFFGDEHARLFGIYHPPLGANKNMAVVVCPPLFAEYLRAHACLRRLSQSLAKKGYSVLRFDYRFTGDSAGDLLDGTLEDWIADVNVAVAEVRELSGVDSVILVGVRFGATLAVLAENSSEHIDRLVLWDPVLDGKNYLRQLRSTQKKLIGLHSNLDKETRRLAEGELVGFEVNDELISDIQQLSISNRIQRLRAGLSLITSRDCHGAGIEGLSAADHIEIDIDFDWQTYTQKIVTAKDAVVAIESLL